MLCKEELSGDNQYHCDFCGKKVDATRQLCLRQLPPYLCMSLQRFVFDMKVITGFTLSLYDPFPACRAVMSHFTWRCSTAACTVLPHFTQNLFDTVILT